MDLLAAIKRKERKLEKELGKLQNKLNGVRAAAKALGDKTTREVMQVKKHVRCGEGEDFQSDKVAVGKV